jgi:hypothetical protein
MIQYNNMYSKNTLLEGFTFVVTGELVGTPEENIGLEWGPHQKKKTKPGHCMLSSG